MTCAEEMDATQCELAIVGAGLACLFVVSKIPEALQKDTVVLDATGTWLQQWTEHGERLLASHLRTPVVTHPHANPLALQSYAQKKNRQQELLTTADDFAPVPSRQLFNDFVRAKVVSRLPPALAGVQQGRVTRLELVADQGLRLQLSSGKALVARKVIYTAAPTQPVLPGWAKALVTSEPLDRRCAPVPAFGPEGQGHLCTRFLLPGMLTWDLVDLRSAELEGRRVVVVGGGMTAASLAVGAAEKGARVTLVCRRRLKQQAFACEAGWWGNKRLHEYLQLGDPMLRLKACRRAQQQGSMHSALWAQLAQHAAVGRVTVLEEAEVAAASYQKCNSAGTGSTAAATAGGAGTDTAEPTAAAGKAAVMVAGEAAGEAASHGRTGGGVSRPQSPCWALHLAPSKWGAEAAAAAARCPEEAPASSAFAAAVAVAAAAAAAGAAATGSPLPTSAPVASAEIATAEAMPAEQAEGGSGQHASLLEADEVWLACGSAYSLERDPLLSQLQAQRPTAVVGGYPLVDDATLAWPGVPLFLAGRAAMLAVGPTAGDLGGMRLAADKIGAALRSMTKLPPAEPAWLAAERRLEGLVLGSIAGTAGAAGVPLEEEGVAYEEPKPQASVTRPPHLIDVSDLDPALPRVELQHYKFTDDEFEICVILQLPEAVAHDQVRTKFGDRSLEMWAVGCQAAYRLHLPKLYGRIITKKCRAKVNTKACKVYLLLHKESDAEWRFLKS